jgi:hypothetical protein
VASSFRYLRQLLFIALLAIFRSLFFDTIPNWLEPFKILHMAWPGHYG